MSLSNEVRSLFSMLLGSLKHLTTLLTSVSYAAADEDDVSGQKWIVSQDGSVSLSIPLLCVNPTIIHWSHIIWHESDDHETSAPPASVENETFLRYYSHDSFFGSTFRKTEVTQIKSRVCFRVTMCDSTSSKLDRVDFDMDVPSNLPN